jgi:hypothetical protein
VNAARMTVRAWTISVRDALGELASVRLCWCLACGRVGLWGWRPLTPTMPITWVCSDRPACQDRQALQEARWRRDGAGSWHERPGPARSGRRAGPAPLGWGWLASGLSCPRDRRRPAPAPPRKQHPEGGSR